MNGALIQQRVYYGYAQAAARVGLPFNQYRPTTAANALASVNLLQSLPASFNPLDMTYAKSQQYGKAAWYCLADGRIINQGDYFQGNGYTYFIAAMDPLLPILAVQCNRTVSVFRPQQQTGVGTAPYGGNTLENQTSIVTEFPASVLTSSKAEKSPVSLPGDSRSGWDTLLLPVIPGNPIIKDHDIVLDDIGNRYLISTAELSEFGWRCMMMEAET